MDVGPIFYSNNGNVTLSSRLDKIRIYKSFYLDTYFNLVWSMEICTLVESIQTMKMSFTFSKRPDKIRRV